MGFRALKCRVRTAHHLWGLILMAAPGGHGGPPHPVGAPRRGARRRPKPAATFHNSFPSCTWERKWWPSSAKWVHAFPSATWEREKRGSMSAIDQICYLCGLELGEDIDRDHVPPKQFYAKNLRKVHKLNLFTLPVHAKCNKFYQKDEDYFVHSIAPLTKGSYSGDNIWNDIARRLRRIQGQRIGQMVLKEFEERPSGLYLPEGKVIKRFDKKRVNRVMWKIVRGLFYKEQASFLPEDTPRLCKFVSVGEEPPPEFQVVRDTPSRGQYPNVFDYKYIVMPELTNFNLWAMLFWDRLIILVAFHDPLCKCAICGKRDNI